MFGKKLLIATMLGCAVAVTSFTPGYATTVSKLMTNEAYVGTQVTVQGQITESYGDNMYKLVDFNGDFIRCDLSKCGVVSGNHALSVTGILVIRDNTMVLDANSVSYDQEQNQNNRGSVGGNINHGDYTNVTVSKLLSSQRYMGQRVAIKGKVVESYGDGYVSFKDNHGTRVALRLNGNHAYVGETCTVYGVPQIANQRLEISVDSIND
ncbi:MAG: hypothetical protein LKF47_00280 [Megasphaera sp.]|jgi:uncharacterized protein YdeI (BOF family)|nr:hypothetical protein [Megasphaera sp.]MCI1247521.1 hypothetical protein [Megasphaera sp.]